MEKVTCFIIPYHFCVVLKIALLLHFHVVLTELRALKLTQSDSNWTAANWKSPEGFELQKNKHQVLHLQAVKREIHFGAAKPEKRVM